MAKISKKSTKPSADASVKTSMKVVSKGHKVTVVESNSKATKANIKATDNKSEVKTVTAKTTVPNDAETIKSKSISAAKSIKQTDLKIPVQSQSETGNEKEEDDDDESGSDDDEDTESLDSDEAEDDAAITNAINSNKSIQNPKSLNIERNRVQAPQSELKKRGTIYISHLPRAFCEPELKTFFQQFGTLTRWRLARSKKSGRPKGYAWLEFELKEIAQIAAKTVNKMLLWGRKLEVVYMEAEKIHKRLYRHWAGKIKPTERKDKARARKQVNNRVIKDANGKTTVIQTKRQRRKNAQKVQKISDLKDLGIDYDFKTENSNPKAKVEEKKVEKSKKDTENKVEKINKKESESSGKKVEKSDSKKDVVEKTESTSKTVKKSGKKSKKA